MAPGERLTNRDGGGSGAEPLETLKAYRERQERRGCPEEGRGAPQHFQQEDPVGFSGHLREAPDQSVNVTITSTDYQY